MYEIGCGVAFFIWLGSLVMLLISINSQLERNLNKVGCRLSWLSLRPKPMDNNHHQRGFLRNAGKFLFIALWGFISIWFSWLYVAINIGSFAYFHLKDAGAPQSVKEFRWRMRNIDLTFDEIVQGMALASGNRVDPAHLAQQLREEMSDRGNA